MALKGGILGRTDDMVVVRGVNLYPAALDGVLRSFAEVAEYRVELRTRRAMTEIHLHVEPVHDGTDGRQLARRIQDKIRAKFHLRAPVTIASRGTLPRFEMKARRWVRAER
jgi:phenylacetate-CoA ligase